LAAEHDAGGLQQGRDGAVKRRRSATSWFAELPA
jgi:hypothetical protein